MDYDIVYSSEYIAITKRKDGYYIESFKNGTSIDQFNSLMGKHSEIRITSFMAIRSTLNFAPKPPIKFGEEKNRISVEISGDELKAFVSLCVAEEEFEEDQKHSLLKEILKTLADNGVVFGLNMDNLIKNLCNNKQILAAEGIYPQNGEDSIIQMFKLKEAKPELRDDGNVDHYELNLINRVKAGEWLGERIDATEGIAGKTVKGNVLQAMSGKTYPLFYDKKTVKEVAENGKTVLYSLCNGAVHYDGDRIGIS
ncbi:MAG: hypothetical protein K0R31_2114, partial [Clostridiales bacterium]|nr:hypothetical protein [Clostridiales bacterium]